MGDVMVTVAKRLKPDGSQLDGYFWTTMLTFLCLALASIVIRNQIARQKSILILLEAYVLVTGHVVAVTIFLSP
jgi:hypothetical protein